jgi:hypothetical protein
MHFVLVLFVLVVLVVLVVVFVLKVVLVMESLLQLQLESFFHPQVSLWCTPR